MSPVFGRGHADHDRARELAAARLDEDLAPADAAWLDKHLAGCPACAAIAAAYDADRAALRDLRAHRSRGGSGARASSTASRRFRAGRIPRPSP